MTYYIYVCDDTIPFCPSKAHINVVKRVVFKNYSKYKYVLESIGQSPLHINVK